MINIGENLSIISSKLGVSVLILFNILDVAFPMIMGFASNTLGKKNEVVHMIHKAQTPKYTRKTLHLPITSIDANNLMNKGARTTPSNK